jgi:hypothetical protein
VGRAPEQRRVTSRLGRCQEKQSPRRLRQLAGKAKVVIFQMPWQARRGEQPEAAHDHYFVESPSASD